MPLITLVSKKRCQSASVICSNGLGSKMPRLLTRISPLPARRRNCVTPSLVARSAAMPSTDAPASVSTRLPDGFLDGALAPAVDHHRGTGLGEAFGDREPDSGGRAADHRAMAMQIDFHDACPVAVAAPDRQRRVGSRVP